MKTKIGTIGIVCLLVIGGFIGVMSFENNSASTGFKWSIETIDSAGDVGTHTSIALDSNGYPHISYFDYTNYDLKYAKWTGNTWSIESVDSTGRTSSISIALDSNNYPHISYLDYTNYDLKYARWTSTTWAIETVDSVGKVGECPSMVLDNSDYPHISYYDYTNGDLKYAKWTGSAWNIAVVDSTGDVGYYTSIALDNYSYPHISYLAWTNTGLKYAKWTGSAWSIETIDSGNDVGMSTSIALDSNDYPHISYHAYENLKYAKWTGSAWSIETLDSTWYSTSIALDSNDYPHISYYSGYPNNDLKYARWTGTTWAIGIVDSAGYVGKWTSMALNSSDYPHISYYDYTNKDLKYAKGEPPTEPNAPIDLIAVTSDTQVSLSWVAPSSDGGSPITNYRIYKGTSSDEETFLVEIGNVLYYNDTGLTNGITYYYKVSAKNTVGEGPLSNEVNATPIGPPATPQNLEASSGDSYINISWSAPASDGGSPITNYRIYKGNSSDVQTFLVEIGNVLYYNDTGLTNGITYYYKVSAKNTVGEGPLSNEVNATPIGPPATPQNLEASSGDSYVNISWSAPASDGGSPITNYRIYKGNSSDVQTFFMEIGNVLYYNDTSLTNGITYYYKVSAINAVGEGHKSNEVSATPSTGGDGELAPLGSSTIWVLAIILIIVVITIIAVMLMLKRKKIR